MPNKLSPIKRTETICYLLVVIYTQILQVYNLRHRSVYTVDRFANGALYDGEWHMGKKQGHGVFKYPDSSKYEGTEWIPIFILQHIF